MSTPSNAYKKWLRQTNASASAAPTTSCHYFRVAGIQVCIRIHRPELAKPFLSAIAHLATPVCQPAYTIDVWDCALGTNQFPAFDHSIDDVRLRGEIPNYSGDGINFAYYAHARMVHILNEHERHGIVALQGVNGLPKFELACPFRGIFAWILRNNQMAMIHSAALADEQGNGYLLMGKSGAGKSTTAISCLFAGMKYIGDDLCAIGLNGNDVFLYSIYSSGKTYRSEWAYIPQLPQLAENYPDVDFDKEIYFFAQRPQSLANSAKLSSIFVPFKGPADSPPPLPSITCLIAETIESTRELLPDAGFEALPLLYAAFKQALRLQLPLRADRVCPINN